MKVFATTPTRISLLGGGTDVAPYSSLYGGVVINLAINLRQKVILSTGDDMFEASTENLFPYGADPKFCYTILDEYKINGLHHSRIKSYFDGIIGAGLGSSGSFAVCLIGAINKINNLSLSKDVIAHEAWRLEVEKIGKYGGKQDQYVAVYGGLNEMFIGKDVLVKPIVTTHLDKLVDSIVLFYVGGKRESSKIQKNYLDLTSEKKEILDRMKKLALVAVDYIRTGDIETVAKLVNQSWEEKKKSNQDVTTKTLDEAYEIGMRNGAWGGKVMGAGGAGYMFFIVDPFKKKVFIDKMAKYGLEDVDFSLDRNGVEVRVL